MTAIVGVLNKQAVAVAADSAVTIGSGRKIYNTANKIFTLSKHHPVGIAIYGNACFNNSIPWEIVVKMYRDQLKDATKPTIKEYASDFFDFLEGYKNKFLPQETLNKALCRDIYSFWREVILEQRPSDPDIGFKKEDCPAIIERLSNIFNENSTATPVPRLNAVTKDAFLASASIILGVIAKQFEVAECDYSVVKDLVESVLYLVFVGRVFSHPSYSGLAFFGYGDDEIYPSIYRVRFYDCIVSTLYWEDEAFAQVDEHPRDSFICPMAQQDEMTAYITGVNPYMEDAFLQTTDATFRLLLESIAQLVGDENNPIVQNIRGIDIAGLMVDYKKKIDDVKQRNMISPLMGTVSTMGKEDLAELAENLIYQTQLKRHITPNLESVGGPVDVAVISKGDGFIWIKRKHYFNPALNQSFFDNYFQHK